MSNLECCEHKEGPVRPQMGPMAFNCLRTLFLYSYIKPHHPYYCHIHYHYPHKKATENSLNLGYAPIQLQLINRPVLAVNIIPSEYVLHQVHVVTAQSLLKVIITLSITLCVKASFCQSSHLTIGRRQCIKLLSLAINIK